MQKMPSWPSAWNRCYRSFRIKRNADGCKRQIGKNAHPGLRDFEDAENGGKPEAKDSFEALINPETYTLEYKVKTCRRAGAGHQRRAGQNSSTPCRKNSPLSFCSTTPASLTARPTRTAIFDDVNHFRQLLTGYQGNSHEPYHLKLVWGNLIFKGRAIELGITYKLFNPDGQPIRAVAKVKFKRSIEEKKRLQRKTKVSGPDSPAARSRPATPCR